MRHDRGDWRTAWRAAHPCAEQNQLRRLTSRELAEIAHEATFPSFGQGDADRTSSRASWVAQALEKKGLQSVEDEQTRDIAVPVKVLGLWDTVEALCTPAVIDNVRIRFLSAPPVIDTDEPNRRYGEKLCNVERAYHALSIDDNRATIFTPLPLARAHMFSGCARGRGMLDEDGRIRSEALQEVWFSGAHSDVGGGYASGALSGVSLSWMLNRLRCTGLLPQELPGKSACVRAAEKNFMDRKYVREDPLGGSHDPTTGLFDFYPKVSRDLVTMAFDATSVWGAHPAPLCVHPTVIYRRELFDPAPHEYNQL